MRFSVVVPVYNVADYLAKCLDSLLPALSEDDEVILSLGKSGDRSSDIALEYAEKYSNIKLVWQKGRGLSDARNCALEAASGDYIICVDSDDYVETEILCKLLARMRKENWQLDVVVHDFRRLERKTDKLVDVFQVGPGIEDIGLPFLPRLLAKRQCFWNVWRFIYRRDFLRKNEIRYLTNVLSEDVAYTADVLISKPELKFVHYPFYVYTVGRGDSLMDKPTLKRLEDTVYVLGYAVEKLRSSDLQQKACVMAQFQFEYLLNMALCWELEKRYRAAAFKLFADWRQILLASSDRAVRFGQIFLQIFGVKCFSLTMYILKKIKRFIRRLQ